MTGTKRNLGRYGETKAAEYLENSGYTVVERNARTSYGEIDIVAGGGILITGLVTTGTATGSISMQAGGRIYMEGDDPVTTDLLEVRANSGIFLRTRVATLDAQVEGEGILEIRETDGIVLRYVYGQTLT